MNIWNYIKHKFIDDNKYKVPFRPHTMYNLQLVVDTIWPQSNQFRIIEYSFRTFNKYGLQSNVENNLDIPGEWVDVETYDFSFSVDSPQWVKLADICSWSKSGLERLILQLTNQNEPFKVIGEVKKGTKHVN